jgi:hypothetical protein
VSSDARIEDGLLLSSPLSPPLLLQHKQLMSSSQAPSGGAAADPNITLTRRRNVLGLFQQFAESQVASGEKPLGLATSFAKQLEISPSMWSQIKKSRPIGDKLARQIEAKCDRPSGWLDEEHEAAGLTPAEQGFIALALKTWRSTNSAGRKRLRRLLKEFRQDGA